MGKLLTMPQPKKSARVIARERIAEYQKKRQQKSDAENQKKGGESSMKVATGWEEKKK